MVSLTSLAASLALLDPAPYRDSMLWEGREQHTIYARGEKGVLSKQCRYQKHTFIEMPHFN